jgi:hypothetical protein
VKDTLNATNPTLTSEERGIVEYIKELTIAHNVDNITRTNAYAKYYERNPEVKWSFLASMVSRNAGWNMCDLEGKWLPKVLSRELRQRLFLTYERANWLIFSDAFPQLCLYELSKKNKKELFHLLPCFSISPFMQEVWRSFWRNNDKKKLVVSLIINEQNLIQHPVINHPVYRDRVFRTWLFLLQDWLHFSTVLFPTRSGELYGCSVHDFQKVTSRIQLGKRLEQILFNPRLYNDFHHFSETVTHTGSRYDYEQFVFNTKKRDTPYLRIAFPIIEHHRHDLSGWRAHRRQVKRWVKPVKPLKKIHITSWYTKKQAQLHAGIYAETLLKRLFLS